MHNIDRQLYIASIILMIRRLEWLNYITYKIRAGRHSYSVSLRRDNILQKLLND